jgi:hypothetical protein
MDVYLLIHPLKGNDVVLHFPFSLMDKECELHRTMFPDNDCNAEMYRRLQVRVSESILRIVEDDIIELFPRNYYILSKDRNEIVTEYEDTYDVIPLCAVENSNNSYQIFLLHDIRSETNKHTSMITLPNLKFINEVEMEEELMLYMTNIYKNCFEMDFINRVIYNENLII